jgi:hypothetical protein
MEIALTAIIAHQHHKQSNRDRHRQGEKQETGSFIKSASPTGHRRYVWHLNKPMALKVGEDTLKNQSFVARPSAAGINQYDGRRYRNSIR